MNDLELFDQYGTAIDFMEHPYYTTHLLDIFVCEEADSFHAFATLNRDQVKQVHAWLGEWLGRSGRKLRSAEKLGINDLVDHDDEDDMETRAWLNSAHLDTQ